MGKGGLFAGVLLASLWQSAHGQCAPAPDSAYFFRNLSESRAEAKLAANRVYYNQLLSDSFIAKDRDGKPASRHEYIEHELASGRDLGPSPFFSIRDYTLLEHRKGYTVASYRLVEGTTRGEVTHATETWLREIYEVVDGKWRLTGIEIAAGAPAAPDTTAAR